MAVFLPVIGTTTRGNPASSEGLAAVSENIAENARKLENEIEFFGIQESRRGISTLSKMI